MDYKIEKKEAFTVIANAKTFSYCVEYYDDPSKYEKGTLDEKYYCEIWVPVKRK